MSNNYIKHDLKNNIISLDVEKYLSEFFKSHVGISKEQIEELYLSGLGVSKDSGKVIWNAEETEIFGFRPNKAIEKISLKVSIDPSGRVDMESL